MRKLRLTIALLGILIHFSNAQITLAQDIVTGNGGSEPGWMTEFNGKLYFRAFSNINNRDEIWEYDGVNPAILSSEIHSELGSPYPEQFIEFNSKLYFVALSGGEGRELWSYDGINPPTMVADINPGMGNANIINLVVFNGKLHFSASNGINGNELWEYDGTSPPSMVADIYLGASSGCSGKLHVFNGKLYFAGNDGINGTELWIYDGINSPVLLQNINPSAGLSSSIEDLGTYKNRMFFRANDGTHGIELWTYDGINPAYMVMDINPNAAHSYPSSLYVHNEHLYFKADNGTNGAELWVYKLSGFPTMVHDTNLGSGGFFPSDLISYNGILYMKGYSLGEGHELWKYDGTNPPKLVEDYNVGTAHSLPQSLTVFKDKLYFSASEPTAGIELRVLNTCQEDIYVDSTAMGAKDGSSWADAFTNLETALQVARLGNCVNTIHVAKGTYYPSRAMNNNSNERYKTFQMVDNVEMLGGYPSGGGIRDWENQPTILSGDLGIQGDVTDNAYHVLLSISDSNNTILDGFIVKYGNANNSSSTSVESTPIFNDYGGGLHIRKSSLILRNCHFKDNKAKEDGAGVFARHFPAIGTLDLVIEQCEFSNNHTIKNGAGVYTTDMNTTISRSHFYDNKTGYSENGNTGIGAGLHIYKGIAQVRHCIFEDNLAYDGAGAYIWNSTSGDVSSCVFTQNTARRYGGGLTTNASNIAKVSNCVFDRNIAESLGAAMFNISGTDAVVNCTFFGNNCTGGFISGIYDGGANDPDVLNSVFWGQTNAGNANHGNIDFSSLSSTVSNNLVQTYANTSSSIIGTNPLFVNASDPDGADNIWMTSDDGLQLTFCSPAADAGDDTSASGITMDITDNDRIKNRKADMGAYEMQEAISYKLLHQANTTIQANLETPNGEYTEYFNCAETAKSRTYLLAIDKNNQDIGKLGDGTFEVNVVSTIDYGSNTATDLSAADYVAISEWYAFNKYWDVNPTNQPSQNVTIRFPYHDQDLNDLKGSASTINNHADMVFFKVDNTNNPHSLNVSAEDYQEYSPGISSTSTWAYSNLFSWIPNSHHAEYMVNSFSGGGGGGGTGINNGALPVELIVFQGREVNDDVLLNWSTASEINNAGFEIQKSNDARSWNKIGFVIGQGNSYEVNDYNFRDKEPNPINYYRLKQIDEDDLFEYSDIIQVNFNTENNIRLYPNPNQGILNIDFSDLEKKEAVIISIFNSLGQLMFKRRSETVTMKETFVLGQLKGIHFVRIKDEEGNILKEQKICFK